MTARANYRVGEDCAYDSQQKKQRSQGDNVAGMLRVKGSMLLSDYGGCRELLRSIT